MWTFRHASTCKICAQNQGERKRPAVRMTGRASSWPLQLLLCSRLHAHTHILTAGLKLTRAHILQLDPCVLSDTCNANTSTYVEIHTTCTLWNVKHSLAFTHLTKWICEENECQWCSAETHICNRNSVGLPPELNSKVVSVGMFSLECGGRQLSIIEQEEQVPESFEATPGGADASTLAWNCNGMLVGRASLECWSRKPNGGILRAWVRSEPPVLPVIWLSLQF